MTLGVHPFPSRTRKLSPVVPKILGWRRPGKIGKCQLFIYKNEKKKWNKIIPREKNKERAEKF
jgi:hypothetical protein